MKNSSIRIISFMAIAIAINYIGANIALFLRLPIYLDMIGTLLVAVVFGPWLGAGTAIVSALISWMTTDIFAIYFAPVAIVAAFITGFLVKETSKSKDLIWKKLTCLTSWNSCFIKYHSHSFPWYYFKWFWHLGTNSSRLRH